MSRPGEGLMSRRPATLAPPVALPVLPRVVRYLAIGLAMYVAVMCIGYGAVQFFMSNVPAMRSHGINIKRVVEELDEDLGPFVAAFAAEARVSSALFIAFGLLLGYCAWVLPFEWKGLPHFTVALFSGLLAFSNHQTLVNAHPWGSLSPSTDTVHVMSIMRIIYAFLAFVFWVLCILSWTMGFAAQRAAAAKRD